MIEGADAVAPRGPVSLSGGDRAGAVDRHALLERRRARHETKAKLALALVGVSVFNSFAPVWGPALGAQAQHPTRAALERIMAQSSGIPSHGVLSTLDAQCLQLRRAPLIAKADAQLDALDRALQLPSGTARTMAVERALVDVGVGPAQARDAAHLVWAAGSTTELAASLQRAVSEGRIDLERLGLAGADALDRVLTDPHLSLAFAAGAAIAPRFPTPTAHALSTLGHIGHGLLNAKLRHDHAIDALKNLHTGNPIVDLAGRAAGEVADLAAFALAFVGPGPLLAAARGTDLLLVAGQLIAAKTAVAGTLKAVGSFSDLPAEIVAFALGVAAYGAAEHTSAALLDEGRLLEAQGRVIQDGVAEAVRSHDPQAALDAVTLAWDQASPREREALRQLIRQGAEHIATDAGRAAIAP